MSERMEEKGSPQRAMFQGTVAPDSLTRIMNLALAERADQVSIGAKKVGKRYELQVTVTPPFGQSPDHAMSAVRYTLVSTGYIEL
jgi:hypothetical protein